MADIATLGIKIDSTQAVTAKANLTGLAAAAANATTANNKLQQSSTAAGKAVAASGTLARHEMINLSRQIQDVGVSLASGQSPLMVLAQQGTQIADIFGSSKTGSVGGALRQVGSGIISFFTPMRALALGVTAVAGAGYLAYQNWKTFALQLDDTARIANTTTRSMSALQAAASFKGIAGDDFNKGIQNFAKSVYDAKNNMGGMAEVFRANNVHAKTFDDYLDRAADLIKNARDDQQRLVLLQQMGLPATMEWVRLLSNGAAGLKAAKDAASEFAANDALVEKARRADEAWDRTWTNFGRNARSAFQTALEGGTTFFDRMERLAAQAGNASIWKGLYSPPTDADLKGMGLSAPKTSFSERFGAANDNPAAGYTGLRSALEGKAKQLNGGGTIDPNALQKSLQLEQQRIGILGQSASVQQQVRAVELQIQQARLAGVNITAQEAENLKRLTAEQALGLTQIRAGADAYKLEAETVGMSTGQAVSYLAAQNAINEAKRAGRPLTDQNIEAIRRESEALGAAAANAENMRWGYENLVRGPLQAFRSELAQGASFFDALKQAGMSALDSISSKLMDMAAQNLFKAAFGGSSGGGLGGLIGGLFGGGSSGGGAEALTGLFAGPHHTGYGPGDRINPRFVPAAVFNGAPRFHTGIGPGERAAIIRNDESVLTPGQMRTMGGKQQQPVVVQITNNNDFRGADPASEARLKRYVDQSSRMAEQNAVQAMRKAQETSPSATRGVR